MQPEGRQGPYGNSSQSCIAIVVSKEIEQSQKTQNQDAQAGQQSVNAVNHVDGIYQADDGEHSQGDSEAAMDGINAPKTLKMGDTASASIDHQQGDKDFYHQSFQGRNVHYVIYRSHIEHNDGSGQYRQQRRLVEHGLEKHQSYGNAEKDYGTAHDRNRLLLKLPVARDIYDRFVFRNFQDRGENKPRRKKSDEK